MTFEKAVWTGKPWNLKAFRIKDRVAFDFLFPVKNGSSSFSLSSQIPLLSFFPSPLMKCVKTLSSIKGSFSPPCYELFWFYQGISDFKSFFLSFFLNHVFFSSIPFSLPEMNGKVRRYYDVIASAYFVKTRDFQHRRLRKWSGKEKMGAVCVDISWRFQREESHQKVQWTSIFCSRKGEGKKDLTF